RGRRDLHAARPARAPCDQGGVSVATTTDSGFADAAAESRLAGAWREFSESRTAVVALAIVVLLIGLSLLAPLIVPQNPYDLTQLSIMDNKLPPLTRGLDGRLYLLGTDDQGRDMLSAILYGLRLSLYVSVVATAIALALTPSPELSPPISAGGSMRC